MNENWAQLSAAEQIQALRGEMDDLLQSMTAMQADLTGLMRRFVDLQTQQNSTYGLVNEVMSTVEKIEAAA